LWTPKLLQHTRGKAAFEAFDSRRQALTLLKCCTAFFAMPNVRANLETTA